MDYGDEIQQPFLNAHSVTFIVLLVLFQIFVTVWVWRQKRGTGTLVLSAFVPFVGIPWLLVRMRDVIRDNHIAGALTYVTLLIAVWPFIFWYPGWMEDDIPWALIHTMQFFGFLGLANLVLTPLREKIDVDRQAVWREMAEREKAERVEEDRFGLGPMPKRRKSD
jgi:hypothetical protein